MKKLILYISMTMLFAACSGDNIGDTDTIIVSNDYISVSLSSIQFQGDETKQELNISANCSWSLSSDASWITIEPSSGSGNSMVTISASQNSSGSERTGTIILKTDKGKLEKKVRVEQGTPTGAIVPTINDNQYPE